MSKDELKRDVDRIFTLASTLAIKDGLPLSALRDPVMSRCYLGRAVEGYAHLMATVHETQLYRLNTPQLQLQIPYGH